MKKVLSFFAFCLYFAAGFAQNNALEAPAIPGNSVALSKRFESYSRLSVNTQELFQELNRETKDARAFKFTLPGLPALETELTTSELFGDDFTTIIQTEAGAQVSHERPAILLYQGIISGRPNSKVALTVSNDVISGMFDLGDGNKYYLEPVNSYDPSAAKDEFVLYNSSDVLETSAQERQSLAKEAEKYAATYAPSDASIAEKISCDPKKLEIAIANDYQMVQLFTNAANVIAHDLTVINLAQTNFDNEFIQPLRFKVTSIYVSSCATCDPWPLTSDYVELYYDFVDWMNAGGFGASTSIDWALLLTPREINDNISGFTAPNEMCNYYRASLIINYTDILCKLQKHVAHGIGISFGASQTSTGIMKPGGTCTDEWAPLSITQINNAILTKPCLSSCVAEPPAEPGLFYFISTGDPVCVTFNNPCVASYGVATDDPMLQVTTSGTTICLNSLKFNCRSSHVFVFANDFCGRVSQLGVSWTVLIDCESPTRNDSQSSDPKDELTVTQNNDFVFIEDPSATPLQKQIRLFDMNGKLLLEQNESSNMAQLSLQTLPAGLYVIRVHAGEKEVTTKVHHF